MKKSEILAIENVKRINEVLRTERNDALALAQERREDANRLRVLLDEAVVMLKDAKGLLNGTDADGKARCAERIGQLLDKVAEKYPYE